MTSLDRRNHISPGEAAIPGEVRRWRAFWLLAVAFFMMIVDLTIVNVALPTIGRKLHFPESDLQWVVTAYALTYGGFLLLGGRAADLLGRRRLFMAGLAIFTAASLACALATSDTFLIIMRGIQGRPARRRLAHPVCRLAVHLLPERPDRRGRPAAGPAGGAGKQAAQHPPALRPARRRHRDRRPRAPGLRDLAGRHRRLGIHSDAGHARGVGGHARRLPGYRDEGRSAAAAPAPVPAEDPRRVERGGVPAGRQLLQLVFHRHPV